MDLNEVLAGSIAYSVPFKSVPAHQGGMGCQKVMEISKRKKRDVGMAAFLNSTEKRMSFQLPCTCNPIKLMSRCLSAPDATSLNHCPKNKQLNLKCISGSSKKEYYAQLLRDSW